MVPFLTAPTFQAWK